MHAMISCWKVWRRTGTFYTFHTCAERSAWTCVNGNTLARTHSPHDVHALCRTLPDGQAHNSGHTLSHTNTHTHAGKHTLFLVGLSSTQTVILWKILANTHTHTHSVTSMDAVEGKRRYLKIKKEWRDVSESEISEKGGVYEKKEEEAWRKG